MNNEILKYISENWEALPDISKGQITASELILAWDLLITNYISTGTFDSNSLPIPRQHLDALEKIGLNISLLSEAYNSVEIPCYDTIYSSASNTVDNALKRLLKKYRSDLEKMNNNTDVAKVTYLLNAAVNASIVYVLYKDVQFTVGNREAISEEVDDAIDRAIEWLFSSRIYIKGANEGWSYNPELSDNNPDIYLTAFVLNALVRIRPDRHGDEFEKILNSIINHWSDSNKLWRDCSGDISLKITSICLRLISNYLDNRTEYIASEVGDVMSMNEIKNHTRMKLIGLQDSDGSWREIGADNCDISLTANIIHSLRTSGIPSSHSAIIKGRDWLLGKIKRCNNVTCWTRIDHRKKEVPSPIDSALIVSALLRSAISYKSVKLLQVIEWLIGLANKKINANDFLMYSTVVCSLGDYLRSKKVKVSSVS